MRFVVQLCSSWQDFSWHNALHRHCAIAELHVCPIIYLTWEQITFKRPKLVWRFSHVMCRGPFFTAINLVVSLFVQYDLHFLPLFDHSCIIWVNAAIFMVALWNRADHYIFILFLSSFFFFCFFLALSQRSEIGCLPYFHTWCGLSANLECWSKMCCTWLSEDTGRKKSPSGHHPTTLLGYIFATKARINNRKKTC